MTDDIVANPIKSDRIVNMAMKKIILKSIVVGLLRFPFPFRVRRFLFSLEGEVKIGRTILKGLFQIVL